ncbi:alpha/beta fold hydrolase [Mannheimia massilioguelmaensis]|uniref:alpha/beta fold hydrolase n=1 Tax=Mannheimia massilioguelmaensis TaxID=1604354 RepID=UPI0005C9B778|nr:alpha/beta fold hydrolase [Mannheimia massilioguelmaensis]
MQLLNHNFHQLKQPANSQTIVFIHGLFGDMNNLGVIARAFSENYNILRIDLRNHGHSFHAPEMSYDVMAKDVIFLLEYLQITHCILVGHSMGGKTAMKVADLRPVLIDKLICIDIGPIVYGQGWHENVFAGLNAVKQAESQSRQQAKPILEQHIEDQNIIQFMLKSFDASATEKFRFNLTALYQNYSYIMGWNPVYFDKPTLFIKGGNSNYLLPEYTQQILQQFPHATSFTIAGCGHWIHAEKPHLVISTIERFLALN